MLQPFEYERVESVADALRAATNGPMMFLAGGQGILSEIGRGVRRPARVVDIGAITELASIDEIDGAVVTGALVRLCNIAGRTLPRGLELLSAAAAHVGFEPIRTLATIGGNLCYGLPTSELMLAAMAADAEVTVANPDGSEKTLRRENVVQIRPQVDESPHLVTGVRWPVPPDDVKVGVDVAEFGEQGGWLPALAITTLVHTKRNAVTLARVAIGRRDGDKLVLAIGDPFDDGGCEDRIRQQIDSATKEESVFPSEWIAALAADSIARASTRARRNS